jgi:DNA polymerase III subunit epsilon
VRLVAIDFETANRHPNSACALGVVQIDNNAIVHEEIFLIRPPSSQFEFTRIHGIMWSDVAQAPNFQQVWTQISTRIAAADALVAHNASFDRRVLYACCDLYQNRCPGSRTLESVSHQAPRCVPVSKYYSQSPSSSIRCARLCRNCDRGCPALGFRL